VTHPDEPGSLASIPITPYRMELSGKQGDITLELLLAKDKIATVDIDPEVAARTEGLIGYFEDGAADGSFFARCRRRIRDFVNRKR
jgi:hypothetical protein